MKGGRRGRRGRSVRGVRGLRVPVSRRKGGNLDDDLRPIFPFQVAVVVRPFFVAC